MDATKKAESKKQESYDDLRDTEGTLLRPIAIDVYGKLGSEGLQLLQDLAHHSAGLLGVFPTTEMHDLRVHISVFVQQYTASMINHRRPASTEIDRR